MTDKQSDALRLADDLESEFAYGRISNHTGRKAAAELRRQSAEIETLRTEYEAARLEIESLKAQLHAAKQSNAAQFGMLAASIPGSALRASHGQAPTSSAVLKAIREANMQLVRTGDDAFMLVPYKVATAQAAASVLEDAMRYRWLRINAIGAFRTNDGNGPVSVYHLAKIPAIPGIPEETDAAIDAARKQGANHD